MQKQNQQVCRRSFDFFSYLTGATYGANKAAFERHLSHCNDCFEAFVTNLNQYLDHNDLSMPRPLLGSEKI